MPESTEVAGTNEHGAPEQFRHLPDRIRLEDTIATEDREPPPDPTFGRNTEQDFVLRNAGG